MFPVPHPGRDVVRWKDATFGADLRRASFSATVDDWQPFPLEDLDSTEQKVNTSTTYLNG